MIPAVFLFTLGVIAFSESCHHFKDIERHRPINHGYALAFRLAIGSVMFAVMSVTHWLLAEDYRFLLLAPMGWAWWTAIFRFTLNNLRGKDWRYMGVDANYDWAFIRMVSGYRSDERGKARTLSMLDSPRFIEWINRAGLYAYTFEALVFASSIAAYFLLA